MVEPGKTGTGGNRLASLDVLRGFALFGILLMNIQGFGLVSIAISNPTLRPGMVPTDMTWWTVIHVLADLKFMTIFSMLFGAGICLLGESRARTEQGFWRMWLWRMFLLAIMGLLHAYLIWFGDILFLYALCGVVLAGMRGLSSKWLLGLGLLSLALGCLIWSGLGALTEFGLSTMEESERSTLLYSAEEAEQEIIASRSGYLTQLPYRATIVLMWHAIMIPSYMFWRVSGLMLIGMALYKWGIFSPQRPVRKFLTWGAASILLGWSITLWGVAAYHAHDWDAGYVFFGGAWRNYWGSLLAAIGYLAVVVAWVAHGKFLTICQNILAAVGRTALSNYLLQSIVATSIFYGHGLGLFERLSYFQLYVLVVFIWFFQTACTLCWNHYFLQGPLEWIWRATTDRQWLPIRR